MGRLTRMGRSLVGATAGAVVVIAGWSGGAVAEVATPGACPVTVEDLAASTSLAWEFYDRRENEPWPADESIHTTRCSFTTTEYRTGDGVPLVFSTDEATGDDAGKLRGRYSEMCVFIGGRERPSGPGVVCERSDGTLLDGVVGDTPRLVWIEFGNATKADAAAVTTPSVDRIMTAIR